MVKMLIETFAFLFFIYLIMGVFIGYHLKKTIGKQFKPSVKFWLTWPTAVFKNRF